MKKNILAAGIFSFVLAVSLSMGGCYYDNAEDLYPTTDTIDTNATYTYTANTKAIIDANCATAGCHVDGTGRQPLTTYTEVANAISNFALKARVESGSMPPTGPMSSAQITAIVSWVDNNYPEN